MTATGEDTQSFECPRCGATVAERFWGPCSACRRELVAAHRNDPAPDEAAPDEAASVEEVAASRFEPSMHVVPNHVATKD